MVAYAKQALELTLHYGWMILQGVVLIWDHWSVENPLKPLVKQAGAALKASCM